MKLETFNIRHGGGNRVNKIIDSIRKHNPDLILLTEFRENKNGERIKSQLYEDGYTSQVSGDTDPKKNTVLLASKLPIISNKFYEELGVHSHRLVLVQFNDFTLVGFYFPQKNEKRPVFEKLVEIFEEYSQKPLIALGDLNTGKHYLDEAGNSFIASEYIDAIEEVGLDAWRKFHGDSKEYTWFSSHGNGFRVDHAFTTKSMGSLLQKAEYSHAERENGISDHSALILEFQTNQAATSQKPTKKAFKRSQFRSRFPAEYRAVDGHYVRSKAEMLIDNWLYMARIIHVYEKKLPIEEDLYCDFFLPEGDVYIEYWGFENEKKYVARKVKKQQIYEKYGFNLIELEDEHVRNIDDTLPALLRKFGIKTL